MGVYVDGDRQHSVSRSSCIAMSQSVATFTSTGSLASARSVKPPEGLYAKVFINQLGKRICVGAYEEPENDVPNWSAGFELPQSLKRLQKCKQGGFHRSRTGDLQRSDSAMS